ncbi:TPA: hypothetical protein ACIRLU_000238 [Streptococcus suis]
MERAGHECVGFCEIDPFARRNIWYNRWIPHPQADPS